MEAIIRDIDEIIGKSKVVIPKGSSMLLSHHFGLDNFRKYGACVIECYNMEEYAKKILVMLPGQFHSQHYHARKHETFLVVYGDLFLDAGDISGWMEPGDLKVVAPGLKHSFSTDKGCVFEEISTHADPTDSIYEIDLSPDRKTFVRYW